MALPVPHIDFSNLKQGTPLWESTKSQVLKAFEEYGCFQALFGQIPQNLRTSVFDGLKLLFDLPLATKQENRSDKPYRGYVGQHSNTPLFESMTIDDVLSLENIESFTGILWSERDLIPTLSKSIHYFAEQLSELDKSVRRMVLESLELEKYMDEHMNSTDHVLRIQKYDAPHSHDTELGLASHTDTNFVTILCQNQVAGLQILTKDGKWVNIEPSPDSFTVFSGDSFHAWTNGRLHSVEHRVIMKGDVARYSIGSFSAPKAGHMIKAPEELVNKEHPRLFKPFDYDKYMKYLHSNPEKKSTAGLKEYCNAN